MKAATPKRPAKKKRSVKQPAVARNGVRTSRDLIQQVEAGVPFHELEALRADLQLPLDQLARKLGLARATLHRRKLSGRLTPDESDKVIRFARLLRQASELFGGNDRARQWLEFPQYGLGGAIPLDYARSEVGARAVENLLGCIEYGIYS